MRKKFYIYTVLFDIYFFYSLALLRKKHMALLRPRKAFLGGATLHVKARKLLITHVRGPNARSHGGMSDVNQTYTFQCKLSGTKIRLMCPTQFNAGYAW